MAFKKEYFLSYRNYYSISNYQAIAKKKHLTPDLISLLSQEQVPRMPWTCTHRHTHTQAHITENSINPADCRLLFSCPSATMTATYYITAIKSKAFPLIEHPHSSTSHLSTSVYIP